MSTEDKLDALRAELARQDAELEAAMSALAELPSTIEAHIPSAWLSELESLCAPQQTTAYQPLVIGIRA